MRAEGPSALMGESALGNGNRGDVSGGFKVFEEASYSLWGIDRGLLSRLSEVGIARGGSK